MSRKGWYNESNHFTIDIPPDDTGIVRYGMVKRPLVQLFYLGRKLGQGQPLADLRQHPPITLLGSGQIVCCKIIVHDKIPGSYGRQFYKMIPRFTEIEEIPYMGRGQDCLSR